MKLVLAIAVLVACGAAAWRVFASSAPPVAAGGGGPARAAPAAAPNLAASAAERDDADGDDGETEEAIALDSVPADVLAAATAAKPGISLSGAEKETEGGKVVYCLTGTADGRTFEVEVTSDGEVVEVEEEDGEDEDR